MGLQGQLSDVSSDSIPLMLVALLATLFKHVRSFFLRFSSSSSAVEEVASHPLLTLLRQVNPVHNAFDLWELTELYLEVQGCAYWLFDFDVRLQIPTEIWILPASDTPME